MQERAQKRRDIQGLRAWAVLFVLIGHLAPGIFPGGFIGVDIFFVISGFVITQQMISLREKYPHSFLRNFYARRIRRIMPSAIFVLLLTFWATRYYLGIVAENDYKGSAGWVSLFLANFHFQKLSLDYFAAGQVIQPIQHFWSLSIEEQFYLIWPALFLVLSAIWLRSRATVAFLIFFIATSLTFSLYYSEGLKGPIFFNSFARVWELALGALLVYLPRRFKFSSTLEIATLALLLIAGLTVAPSMQWPRLTAVPVIIATCYLLHRGEGSKFSILSSGPMGYIGDLSYLIYLWHWPILIIVKNTRPIYDGRTIGIVLLLTLIATLVTHYAVEKPLRSSDLLLRKPIATIASALSLTTVISSYFFLTYKG
jgi:peptidoglycan/LPS O-acetylase OafA/YrhL